LDAVNYKSGKGVNISEEQATDKKDRSPGAVRDEVVQNESIYNYFVLD
jgi:hypothetical protein